MPGGAPSWIGGTSGCSDFEVVKPPGSRATLT